MTTAEKPSRPPWHDGLFMKTVRREPADGVPIWLMRQAGRYMAEYRQLRKGTSFLDLCKNPQLCAEVMLMTVERLGVDAAIIFSDLLLILEPLGLELDFVPGGGPVLGNPIRGSEDIDRLRELEDVGSLDFVMETVRQTRAGLAADLPVIGFAGAPFTLAGYAIEGGTSRSHQTSKTLMYRDTGAWDALMSCLVRAITLYLNAQIEAGAQVVQLFDSWVGCLGVDDYRRYVLPYSRAIIEGITPGVPVVHFATGNPALLPALTEALGNRQGDSVVGVDWRIRLDDAWKIIGYDKA
ncbi:hypothetical protein LCGC14_2422670, partial [marine sediment metagenome]